MCILNELKEEELNLALRVITIIVGKLALVCYSKCEENFRNKDSRK